MYVQSHLNCLNIMISTKDSDEKGFVNTYCFLVWSQGVFENWQWIAFAHESSSGNWFWTRFRSEAA